MIWVWNFILYPFTLFLLGGLAATAAEYGMAILYERGLGVSFWDYTGLPGSIQGKICLCSREMEG